MNGIVKLDTLTRTTLAAVVRELFQKERDRQMEEVWLSKEDFLKQFGMFTEDWLRRYGYLLPRCRVTVEDNGETRESRYAYARNEIQRMIAENRLEFEVSGNGKARGGKRSRG